MLRTIVPPTGIERTFGNDELIVSKTDLQGRITYANDVFLRVSCCDPQDVLGQPHNFIRHPEMPRGVFALLWERLNAGQEIFAYINNLALDGANYWVLAHVTPSRDAHGRVFGYHSNRRLPCRSAIQKITPIYQKMLKAEKGQTGRDAASASLEAMASTLRDIGQEYDEYIWNLVSTSGKAAA